MTPKERVLTAIDHEEPDRIPLDAWLAPELVRALKQLLDIDTREDDFALEKALGHDVLYRNIGFCDGFSSIYREEREIGENLYQDRFGIKWKKQFHAHGCYAEFAEHPLADIGNYDTYSFPDPLESVKQELEMYARLIERDGKDHAIIGGVACTMLEGAWYLRGFEDFLMDFKRNRDFVIDLLDRTKTYSLAISRELVRMGVDIIWWGDDFAMEAGPIIDPAIVRELLIPRYAEMVAGVRQINPRIKIAFHTDGKIDWLLDDLVEIGIDILNPLQPDVNDVKAVNERYGRRLTFWGNVDTRRVMSGGSVADVVNEVRKVIAALAPGGGHILCSNHRIQSTERALDNTLAYYWAADHFRDYPIMQVT